MRISKQHLQFAVKGLLAAVLLAGLAGVAGSQLAPNVPLMTILLNCAFWAVIVFAVLIVAAAVTLTFNQFILRHGGTDAAWFWFKAEPPGLERQRALLKEQNK